MPQDGEKEDAGSRTTREFESCFIATSPLHCSQEAPAAELTPEEAEKAKKDKLKKVLKIRYIYLMLHSTPEFDSHLSHGASRI